MSELLLHDGLVVTMDAGRRLLDRHPVVVRAGRIVEVGLAAVSGALPVPEGRCRGRGGVPFGYNSPTQVAVITDLPAAVRCHNTEQWEDSNHDSP